MYVIFAAMYMIRQVVILTTEWKQGRLSRISLMTGPARFVGPAKMILNQRVNPGINKGKKRLFGKWIRFGR